ncbi:MAG: hypothetical protein ATN35_03730 [Epulopiscium sp. Nele67-Bin004]|nr:MAG: hypothetical protein ATN35_03730 [Epulopiscium sp. Nele67-Bin004]
MKKFFSILGMSLMLSSSVFASVPIYIDSVQVPTEPQQYYSSEASDYVDSKYYLDVEPELKDGRVYVPINLIANFFDMPIEWTSPNATLTYNDSQLVLTIGSDEATVNGVKTSLDAPPYINNGRTMVPLRFISETFNLDVNYVDGAVYVDTSTSFTSPTGVLINSISSMNQGGDWVVFNDFKSTLAVNRIHEVLSSAKSEYNLIDEPEEYGSIPNTTVKYFFNKADDYYFVSSTGNLVDAFTLYSETDMMTNTGVLILQDNISNTWYEFSQEKRNTINELETIGEWVSTKYTSALTEDDYHYNYYHSLMSTLN